MKAPGNPQNSRNPRNPRSPRNPKILVIRPDRLGDVILSTPVFEALHQIAPGAHVTALVQESMVPILKGLGSIQDFLVFDPKARHHGWRGLLTLVREIRKGQFDLALTLQSNRWIAAAVFLAGIPIRVGPLSKPHSYLFYNQGLRQRRSQVEMHEADYNLELLKKTGLISDFNTTAFRNPSVKVSISSEVKQDAKTWLEQNTKLKNTGKWVAVHPGMGGSALNWPLENYIQLIESLLSAGARVLVTFGPAEASLAEKLKKGLAADSNSQVVYYQAGLGDSVEFLGGLFSQMDLVVAPSTGPLHLAVSVGRPVVTFYPNIKVQSKERWGPYTQTPEKTVVLVPQVDCSTDSQCMKTLTVPMALQACTEILGEKWQNQTAKHP